ncbi:hypothetical protein BBFGKLBO_00310 [Synechococcus sp. CBW1107]|uniref:hypothetical protein n=1 Tax=unclassified Synechococcus TaxID=2626047 RepID=UPI001E642AAE|nr:MULTISPECIES: hypothetical protein [unclassified Synechococcus]CAK6687923.1 hypothetical protein BBFGKLBO_00310 [Synechococcus sp. CBW1107]
MLVVPAMPRPSPGEDAAYQRHPMATLLTHRLQLVTAGPFRCHDITAALQALGGARRFG